MKSFAGGSGVHCGVEEEEIRWKIKIKVVEPSGEKRGQVFDIIDGQI